MTEGKHLDEMGKINLACECYVICGDKVLMFKRSATASKFPGFLAPPGGHIDSNEEALTAAIREVKEETGIVVEPKNIKLKAIAFHYHIDRGEIWISFVFLANISEHQKESEENTEGKAEWFSIDKLQKSETVFPPVKYYLEHVINDKSGLIYANITWEKAQLVKVNSHVVDKNG